MQTNQSRFVGYEIGGYHLLQLIGEGGNGLVYRAHRLNKPDELFAIKLLDTSLEPDLSARSSLQSRFRREAQALTQLQHPNILPIISYGEQGDLLYMALPYISGGTLSARIGGYPHGMPTELVAEYLSQLASALDYAHQHGIVHRDIKPENVLIGAHEQLQVADFGIAHLLWPTNQPLFTTSGQRSLTTTGQIIGTPLYMAPEQIIGGNISPATDVYALGIIVYQMVAGSLPFQALTPVEVLLLHLSATPPPLHPKRVDLPTEAEAAIFRALAKRPEERYKTAGELAMAFSVGLRRPHSASAHYSAATIPQAKFAAATAQPAPPARRRAGGAGWAVAAAIMTLALVLAVIGFNTFSRQPSPSTSGSVQQSSSGAQWASASISAGSLIYETHTPGNCDQQGASWASNGNASQSCQGGTLIMSEPESNGPIGVATLSSLPSESYPSDYVAQVTINILGGARDAKFGFKFRQQSVQDSNGGRGGYSFLVDPNGQWQFNRYDDGNGARHILAQQQLPSGLQGKHTLDLVVSGDSYEFYIDDQLIDSEQNTVYQSGFFCLAIEPGATVAFYDLALFRTS